jgi:predicted outer membrane protein
MILRRTILAALAAVAATSSLAQTRADKTPGAPAAADQEYVRQSLAASSLSLAISRIASHKAQTDDLKEFAQLEEGEQETLAGVLKSLSMQNASINDRTVIRRLGDAEVEQHLDQRGRQVLEKLRADAAGAEFDRDYMGALATGHLELLRIQEAYLDSGQNNANIINVAKLARSMIKEHLQLLADIESGMETASGGTIGAAPGKDH